MTPPFPPSTDSRFPHGVILCQWRQWAFFPPLSFSRLHAAGRFFSSWKWSIFTVVCRPFGGGIDPLFLLQVKGRWIFFFFVRVSPPQQGVYILFHYAWLPTETYAPSPFLHSDSSFYPMRPVLAPLSPFPLSQFSLLLTEFAGAQGGSHSPLPLSSRHDDYRVWFFRFLCGGLASMAAFFLARVRSPPLRWFFFFLRGETYSGFVFFFSP